MQTNDYLEKMGIQTWSLRSIKAKVDLLPPHYAVDVMAPQGKALVLADKVGSTDDEKNLLLAIISAMKFPFLEKPTQHASQEEVLTSDYGFIILLGEAIKAALFPEDLPLNRVVMRNQYACLQTYSLNSILNDKALKAPAWEALKEMIKRLS